MPKMLSSVLKNFIGGSATRKYPIEIREAFENYRGELINSVSECTFCGICQKKCPSQCITVVRKEGVWDCDPFLCVYCGICVDACPKGCLTQKNIHRKPSRVREMISLKGEPPVKKAKKA